MSPQGIIEIPGTLYLHTVLDRAIRYVEPTACYWVGGQFYPMKAKQMQIIFDARFKGMDVMGFYGEPGNSPDDIDVFGCQTALDNARCKSSDGSYLYAGTGDFYCPNPICNQPVSSGHIVCPFCHKLFLFKHANGSTFIPRLNKLVKDACAKFKFKVPTKVNTNFVAAVCVQGRLLPKRGTQGAIRDHFRDTVKWQLNWIFLELGVDKDPVYYKEMGNSPWIRKIGAVAEASRNWNHEQREWPDRVKLCDFNEIELIVISCAHNYALRHLRSKYDTKLEDVFTDSSYTLLKISQLASHEYTSRACSDLVEVKSAVDTLYREIFNENVPPRA